jgi:hypothetical protein
MRSARLSADGRDGACRHHTRFAAVTGAKVPALTEVVCHHSVSRPMASANTAQRFGCMPQERGWFHASTTGVRIEESW